MRGGSIHRLGLSIFLLFWHLETALLNINFRLEIFWQLHISRGKTTATDNHQSKKEKQDNSYLILCLIPNPLNQCEQSNICYNTISVETQKLKTRVILQSVGRNTENRNAHKI